MQMFIAVDKHTYNVKLNTLYGFNNFYSSMNRGFTLLNLFGLVNGRTFSSLLRRYSRQNTSGDYQGYLQHSLSVERQGCGCSSYRLLSCRHQHLQGLAPFNPPELCRPKISRVPGPRLQPLPLPFPRVLSICLPCRRIVS